MCARVRFRVRTRRRSATCLYMQIVVVVSATGGCGAKDRCVGLTPAQTHGTCTPANGKRGAVRTRTGVWGNSRGLRGNVVYLDRLVEAELFLLRIETRDERKGHTARASVAKPGIGGGRATTVRWPRQNACAMAYIITSAKTRSESRVSLRIVSWARAGKSVAARTVVHRGADVALRAKILRAIVLRRDGYKVSTGKDRKGEDGV